MDLAEYVLAINSILLFNILSKPFSIYYMYYKIGLCKDLIANIFYASRRRLANLLLLDFEIAVSSKTK